MAKLYILICIVALFSACSNPDFPIIFEKNIKDSQMSISLNKDSTFEFSASHVKGTKFLEQGTYSVHDSVLILHYANSEFGYNCYNIPLENDTLLFGTFNSHTLLYNLFKINPITDSILTKTETMNSIIQEYNNPMFHTHIGTFVYNCTQGNAKILYPKQHKISEYYDSFIK